MAGPAITVLLPFRNALPYLPACLDSILHQTMEDFEILAVDDGSTDESTQILRSRRDTRIRIVPAGGRGIVAALQTGLHLARAPLVARMDADDVAEPDRFQAQVAILEEHPEIDLAACQVRPFPEEEIRLGLREYVDWQNRCLSPEDVLDEIYVESPFAHPSVMFRRHTVLRLGGYRQGPFPEDYDLWLRMAAAGCRMLKLPRVLLHWRDRAERASRVDPRYSDEAFDDLRADYLARDPRIAPPTRLVFWGAGRATRRRSDRLRQRGFEPEAYVDIDPKKIGNRVNGIPVVGPAWLEKEPRPFVLGYVRVHGARDLVASRLEGMGYRRGQHYLMVG